jgi:hypothetical protein
LFAKRGGQETDCLVRKCELFGLLIAGRCRDVSLLRATFSFNGVNLYRESLQTYRRQTARADRDETGTIQ